MLRRERLRDELEKFDEKPKRAKNENNHEYNFWRKHHHCDDDNRRKDVNPFWETQQVVPCEPDNAQQDGQTQERFTLAFETVGVTRTENAKVQTEQNQRGNAENLLTQFVGHYSIARVENSQQEQEQVDEIEIQGKRSGNGQAG